VLRLVVIDPELRLLLRQYVGDTLHRGKRLIFVSVTRRHAAIFPVALEVNRSPESTIAPVFGNFTSSD
jgi:hypothetical protein